MTKRREPPPNRGRLLTAREVAELIGGRTPRWVKDNVPARIDLGPRTYRWAEDDVWAWIMASRDMAGAAHRNALAELARLRAKELEKLAEELEG